jgi:hypothetical protein
MKKTIITFAFLISSIIGFSQAKDTTTKKVDSTKIQVNNFPVKPQQYFVILNAEQINYFYTLLKSADEKPSILNKALNDYISMWQIVPADTTKNKIKK